MIEGAWVVAHQGGWDEALFVAGPLVVLYLVGIGLAYFVQPKKPKELSA